LRSFRPHEEDSRDMSVFQDDDGSAWLICSSEKNLTTHVSRLTDDYLHVTETFERVMIDNVREAPTAFRHGEKLYMINSGCSGWWPNPSQLWTADRMDGQWSLVGDPFIDDSNGDSLRSQGACIIPMPGAPEGHFIYMGDRWIPDDLANSTYIWLPFEVRSGNVAIRWRDSWSPASYLAGLANASER
jgi:hypothetical protein